MMGNAGMVLNLEQIQFVEDKNLLGGHILVLLGQDYDAAQASLDQYLMPTFARWATKERLP